MLSQKAADIEKGKDAGIGKLDAGLNERYHYILRTRVGRVSSAATLCLLITALLVMTVGLFGGLYIYSQMTRPRVIILSGNTEAKFYLVIGECNLKYFHYVDAESQVQAVLWHTQDALRR